MNAPVGGNHEPVVHSGRLSGMVRGPSAGFPDEKNPGCHVPRLEAELPVSIQPPGRHPGEIEGGGPESANSSSNPESVCDRRYVCVRSLLPISR